MANRYTELKPKTLTVSRHHVAIKDKRTGLYVKCNSDVCEGPLLAHIAEWDEGEKKVRILLFDMDWNLRPNMKWQRKVDEPRRLEQLRDKLSVNIDEPFQAPDLSVGDWRLFRYFDVNEGPVGLFSRVMGHLPKIICPSCGTELWVIGQALRLQTFTSLPTDIVQRVYITDPNILHNFRPSRNGLSDAQLRQEKLSYFSVLRSLMLFYVRVDAPRLRIAGL